MVELFGIPLMYNHTINDAELARSFFMTEKAQGHLEMSGFWELMAHYRELTQQKGAYAVTKKELGAMRDLNPFNPIDSTIMKLSRKRILEFSSSSKQFPVNLDRKRASRSPQDHSIVYLVTK